MNNRYENGDKMVINTAFCSDLSNNSPNICR